MCRNTVCFSCRMMDDGSNMSLGGIEIIVIVQSVQKDVLWLIFG